LNEECAMDDTPQQDVPADDHLPGGLSSPEFRQQIPSPPPSTAAAIATTSNGAIGKPYRAKGEGGGPGRKPRACLECKRLKMKCEFLPGERKCSRCSRKDLECTSNKGMVRGMSASAEGYEWVTLILRLCR